MIFRNSFLHYQFHFLLLESFYWLRQTFIKGSLLSTRIFLVFKKADAWIWFIKEMKDLRLGRSF